MIPLLFILREENMIDCHYDLLTHILMKKNEKGKENKPSDVLLISATDFKYHA